jgi:hypothetical protein
VPFLASVLLLTIPIAKDFRKSQVRSQTQADLQASGKRWLSDEIGNPWITVIGDVCGIIIAAAWLFLA